MAEIKVLRPEIYNIIAAGEVIEKPIGAVKELVENSIDAGATRIVIEVEGGGFDLITITDNGFGIHEDDLELAFVKHATSKISNADDLYALQTLGFRGEALPSIAAVSHVKLTTRPRSSDTGICVNVEDGVVTNKEYVSCNVGTKIEVRGLFYNIPVKKNFFKTVSGEAADITKYVARLILTNPNLEISYTLDGKLIYSTKGDGLKEAIYAVYGADCLSNCLEVSFHREDMRIFGYVGNPQYTKANKSYQTLAVNGRYIIDQNISGAITRAFMPNLMTRQYPFYVLHLEIPSNRVDANVHPKKMEVRFTNQNGVCSAFYRAVKDALDNYVVSRMDSLFASTREQTPVSQSEQQAMLTQINEVMKDIEPTNPDQKADIEAIDEATILEDYRSSFDEFAKQIEQEVTVEKARQALGIEDDKHTKVRSVPLIEQTTQREDPVSFSETDTLFFKTRILGIAFKTYLILEIDDKVILVDQHAAHERILFDKFMSRQTGAMQSVMFPYVFTVKDDEALFIEENIDNILDAGIQIEPFGHNTFRIVAVSTLLADTEMRDFVQFLVGSIDEYKLDDKKLIVEKIARKACKAAVKAGYLLNEYEIRYILQEVYNNKILQCPHGRPITVVLTKTQIEKMFKRIV
ncbi:MAG: DNA mismatch repair endonuclease MutL [Clostridiales bacterium]|nr:DNA mismatch repair endonuclease MutL [Clostridiales bacterium]